MREQCIIPGSHVFRTLAAEDVNRIQLVQECRYLEETWQQASALRRRWQVYILWRKETDTFKRFYYCPIHDHSANFWLKSLVSDSVGQGNASFILVTFACMFHSLYGALNSTSVTCSESHKYDYQFGKGARDPNGSWNYMSNCDTALPPTHFMLLCLLPFLTGGDAKISMER